MSYRHVQYITYHLQGVWLTGFENQQQVVFKVVIIHVVCIAVAYKIKLKCGYSNEAYSSAHKSYIVVLAYEFFYLWPLECVDNYEAYSAVHKI